MPSFTVLRRSFASLAGLTLLLFGLGTEVRSGACQSYEAAFNFEAGMRDGLTLKQAKASIVEDGYTDGSVLPALQPSRMKSTKCPMPFHW